MATITLNIPDTFIQRAIDAYLNDFNYQTQIPNPDFDPEQPEGEGNEKLIDNPETPAQFTKRMVGEEVKGRVLRYESGVATANPLLTINALNWTFANQLNFIFSTINGTKFGTATDQKIGFFNATPVIQQAGIGETVGFSVGVGTGVNDDSTFTGNVGATAYRISDIIKALKNLGLIAS